MGWKREVITTLCIYTTARVVGKQLGTAICLVFVFLLLLSLFSFVKCLSDNTKLGFADGRLSDCCNTSDLDAVFFNVTDATLALPRFYSFKLSTCFPIITSGWTLFVKYQHEDIFSAIFSSGFLNQKLEGILSIGQEVTGLLANHKKIEVCLPNPEWKIQLGNKREILIVVSKFWKFKVPLYILQWKSLFTKWWTSYANM